MGCFSQQEVHAELEENGKRIRDSQTQTHFVQNIPEGFISRSQVPEDFRHGMEMGARMEDEPIQNPADVCHEFITASVTVRVVIAIKNAARGRVREGAPIMVGMIYIMAGENDSLEYHPHRRTARIVAPFRQVIREREICQGHTDVGPGESGTRDWKGFDSPVVRKRSNEAPAPPPLGLWACWREQESFHLMPECGPTLSFLGCHASHSLLFKYRSTRRRRPMPLSLGPDTFERTDKSSSISSLERADRKSSSNV